MNRRRAELIEAAALLPPGSRVPDELLFADGFDPSDTLILDLVNAVKPDHGDDGQHE